MDPTKVKRLRCTLTLHFAVIAWLTAMLVATGSDSLFLPILIFFVSLAGFVFVDTLEWFEIGRIGSYFGMTAATSIAVGIYVYNTFYVPSESGQLLAVAGLLVFPEAVLFLQRKNLRIFEQLAIFLLLEMVVAALVNDNIVFGILLAPIVILWVSSLFLFARYATLVQIDPTIEQPVPKLAELLFRRVVSSVLGDSGKKQVVSSRPLASPDVLRSRMVRRTLQSVPIGLGALAFAGLFFYLLPRTTPAGFQPPLGPKQRVGLPKDSLAVGVLGRILQDPTPVMRITLTDVNSRQLYEIAEPPYLRARVFDFYGSTSRRYRASRGEWRYSGIFFPRPLDTIETLRPSIVGGRDLVEVEFDIERQFASTLYTVPPCFAINKQQKIEFGYDSFSMLLDEYEASELSGGKSLVYQIGSAGFGNRTQLPVMPARLRRHSRDGLLGGSSLYFGFPNFFQVDEYRRMILRKAGCPPTDVLRAAREFESHLVTSGEFRYTLDLSPPSDPDIDPIEDFVVNQRKGHCQYFASALLVMMRQTGIPGRIVVGYRPLEFNSLGGYFSVKQSDAHAWVEGLFSREQLEGSDLDGWLTDSPYYWVRFDPTPSSEGGEALIVEQQGQAIDYVEKLWKDYVVEGQKLNGENSLYAPVAENSQDAYKGLVDNFNRLRNRLEDGSLLGGAGLAGPLAVVILVLVAMGFFIWRLAVLLPRLAPSLAKRLGMVRDKTTIEQAFYARCLKLLEDFGLQRHASQTPREFTQNATLALSRREAVETDEVGDALNFLTSLYYRLRFSAAKTMTTDESQAIDTALSKIELATAAARKQPSE